LIVPPVPLKESAGVNVDMTPTIHGDRDVTLKLGVEISAKTDTVTIDNVQEPVISQQKADQVIRLKDGQMSILAGLQKSVSSHTASGWPGLGEIPLLKYLSALSPTKSQMMNLCS
jgi:general secretion pathway protein D